MNTLTDEQFRAVRKRVEEYMDKHIEHGLDYKTKSRLTNQDRLSIEALCLDCYLLGHSELIGSEIQVSSPLKPLPDEGDIS